MREPFVASNYVKFGVSERDVLLYKELFDMMDPKARGYISPNDLKSALLSIGINLSRADLFNLVCDYDNHEGGVLSFEDFVDAVTGGQALRRRQQGRLQASVQQTVWKQKSHH